MKRIKPFLVAFTAVCIFLFVDAHALFQKEPDGFGGIKWGTDITELKGMKYLYTDPHYGGIQIYKSKRNFLETLKGHRVWSLKVKSIEYGFWRGKFSNVIINTKGKASFVELKDACFEKFGQGLQQGQNKERYTWSGKITLIGLEYLEFSEEGILWMASTKIRRQQDAFAKQMVTGGGVTWAKTYGGMSNDYATSIQQTKDGGYIVTGVTYSFGAGSGDLWVLKLDASGNIQWQKTYGGTKDDRGHCIHQTGDGGYILAGIFGENYGDMWILKLDMNGSIQWQKTYDGMSYEAAHSIQQTMDGGYIVAGETDSFGVGYCDIWILKLDSNGNIQWQKTYGGMNYEIAQSIQQTTDGGYIVAGYTYPIGAIGGDFWVLKLDANGNIQWQKTYGGMDPEFAYFIQQTTDGGYIVAGETTSFKPLNSDFWILKLDTNGNIQWQKTYGGMSGEITYSVQQTMDGGYIVAGLTESFGAGYGDIWILKLDTNGNIQWQKTYDNINFEVATSIQKTTDGGFIVAGNTTPFGTMSNDFWVLKLDPKGNISDSCPSGIGQATSIIPANTFVVPINSQAAVSNTSCTVTSTNVTTQDTKATINTQCFDILKWAKTYGGTKLEAARSVQQTTDGGYIVAGNTDSFGAGGSDLWVLKLTAGGDIQWQKTYGGTEWDEYPFIQQTTDGGYIVTGSTKSFGAGHYDIWILKLDASGKIQWQKTYGGINYEPATSIQQTTDSGYIVVGFTYSFGAGSGDLWVLKLDASGNIQWQKTYGGTKDDRGYFIQQTKDGGYVVAGSTTSFGGSWGERFWVLKLNAIGNIQWQKTYGLYGQLARQIARSIQQTADDGYIVAGEIWSFGAGHYDIWILKLDTNGNIQWQKTYGGAFDENVFSIQQTPDYGYIVAGYAHSSWSGEDWEFVVGESDGWLLKLDTNGDIQWQKTYGGTENDSSLSIRQTLDGGYIVAGITDSFGAGGSDFWVLKFDAAGNISNSCPSGIGQATSIIPANTSVVPVVSQATISNTSCTVTSTNVTPQDTNATVETQCDNY
jgi:hypothetical protein